MIIWQVDEASPTPKRVRAGEPVKVQVGTGPIEAGQSVWVCYRIGHTHSFHTPQKVAATWRENSGDNSYWIAELGPFRRGERVEYWLEGSSPAGTTSTYGGVFEVRPRLWLALLWHQHQPLYRDLAYPQAKGSYLKPWVRLHALRDYYAMPALVAEHPELRISFNLTPILLLQLNDYAEHGATDTALELTLKPAEILSVSEHEEILRTFFDADWHNQILLHPRYRELFAKRAARNTFSDQEIRDLQMWFNLAWFGKEFREGEVELVTGEIASVRRFIEQGQNFSANDVAAMVQEQFKVLRAIVPLHRALQELGLIEVTTTPMCHPILPLLVDTDRATIDRSGATCPPRFAYPEDAEGQVAQAVADYERYFHVKPRGMWPAEGAVSRDVIPLLAKYGIRWFATDQGVLGRSGRWGYRADLPEVLCRPYRIEEAGQQVYAFFRATAPSDAIGFQLQSASDYEVAVREFVQRLVNEYTTDLSAEQDDRILTIALDGENAWSSYRDDGRPFLRTLYAELADHPEIQTVTFSDYLNRRSAVGVEETQLHELFTGSWIDEAGSAPGVDLGTWIGETEENRAWTLLGSVRDQLRNVALTDQARLSLYAAEGSDWFWWYGQDQNSGTDQEFDDLFRLHLSNALRLLDREVPAEIGVHIVPHATVWTFSQQVDSLQHQDQLVVRTNCPGILEWWIDGVEHGASDLNPVGGVMAGAHRFESALGPFAESTREVVFRFECRHAGCHHDHICCGAGTHHVSVY